MITHISPVRQLSLWLTAVMVMSFVCDDANAQKPYSWKSKAGKQGTYSYGVRFIRVQYQGPPDPRLWKRAFAEAAKVYIKEDISHPRGADGDWFPVRGLSSSRKEILGYVSDDNKTSGYLVITKITPSRVYYELNDGQKKSIGKNPGNFEKWTVDVSHLGGLGEGPNAFIRTAAVQVWKHGGNNYDAGVSFRSLTDSQ